MPGSAIAPTALHVARGSCNRSATVRRTRRLSARITAIVVVLWVSAAGAGAQTGQAVPSGDQREGTARSFVEFLGGAAGGFVAHESGHLAFDGLFGADPTFKRVSFAGIPFFAISPRDGITPREEYVIASAGFWVQHATSEWMLTSRPDLRRRHAPFLKGWLAWNVLASTAYSVAAFARIGPPERDTRGIAEALRIPEPYVGAMILAPAALDAYRYARPDSKWARWSARAIKIGLVVAVVAAKPQSK